MAGTRQQPRRVPIALLEDGQLTGRRLGRKPTRLDLEEAKRLLDRLSPDSQKCVVWLVRKMAAEEGPS